jgi:hypothetical protein
MIGRKVAETIISSRRLQPESRRYCSLQGKDKKSSRAVSWKNQRVSFSLN